MEGLRNGDNVTFIGNTTLVWKSHTVASVNSGPEHLQLQKSQLQVVSWTRFCKRQTGTANIIRLKEYGYVQIQLQALL